MNEITIAFNKYLKSCYPNGCPENQKSEVKQAFFSGAFVMFNSVLSASNNLTEEQAEKKLTALTVECESVLRARIGATRKAN